MKLIIPYKVPAKFGAKSCAFCRLVNVDAPLKPREIVITATHQYGWWPTYASPIKHAPGKIWAEKKLYFRLLLSLYVYYEIPNIGLCSTNKIYRKISE